MDIETSEQLVFIPEQVESIVMAVIDGILRTEIYIEEKASHWVNIICEKSMQELHDLGKPFKYVVSCAIVQKNGAGFHTGHSAYWDMTIDNLCQVAWPTEKMREQQGSRMKCIVTVFGLSL
ncbi:unnamed protein product [Ascophyllum nodosum]